MSTNTTEPTPVELHLYGGWEDKAPTLKMKPDGEKAVRWMKGDDSIEMTPEIALVIRRLFGGQEKARQTLDLGLRTLVTELQSEANPAVADMESPTRYADAVKQEHNRCAYMYRMEAAQRIVDALNEAAIAWGK